MTNWRKLKHARGLATKVPEVVASFCAENELDRRAAFFALQHDLVRRDRWYTASAPAVSLLLEALPDTPADVRRNLLVLVADIVGGNHERAWLAPASEKPPPLAAKCQEAAAEASPVILKSLRSRDGDERGAAAVLLAMLPTLDTTSCALLRKTASKDKDDVARTCALLALARLDAREDSMESVIDEASNARASLVRGAAGIARLRIDESLAVEAAASDIESWLSWEGTDRADFPFFGTTGSDPWVQEVPHRDGPPRMVVALALQRGAAGSKQLLEVATAVAAHSKSGVAQAQATKIVIEVGGLRELEDRSVVPFDELGLRQQATAHSLANTLVIPRGGYGLPASGGCRRRWAGIEARGPLERPVGSKRAKPLWLAYNNASAKAKPAVIEKNLNGLERWQAYAELACGAYDSMVAMGPADVERELALVQSDEGLLKLAAALADDVSLRYAAAARIGRPVPPSRAASGLVLLPLFRSGKKLEPSWDHLISLQGREQTRELLEGLPAKRREALLLRHLETWGDSHYVLDIIYDLLVLAPTHKLAVALLSRAVRDSQYDRVRKLAAEHTALKKALKAVPPPSMRKRG